MSILDTVHLMGTESDPRNLYIAELFGVSPIDEECGCYRRFGDYDVPDDEFMANLAFVKVTGGFANSAYTIRGASYVKFIGTDPSDDANWYVCCNGLPSECIQKLQRYKIDIVGDCVTHEGIIYVDGTGNYACVEAWTCPEGMSFTNAEGTVVNMQNGIDSLPSVTLSDTGELIYTNKGLDPVLDMTLEFASQDLLDGGGTYSDNTIPFSVLRADLGLVPGVYLDDDIENLIDAGGGVWDGTNL